MAAGWWALSSAIMLIHASSTPNSLPEHGHKVIMAATSHAVTSSELQ